VASTEVSENLLRVVADCGEADAALSELVDTSLQLDELSAAERTPIC
jgi:hypothetical protein